MPYASRYWSCGLLAAFAFLCATVRAGEVMPPKPAGYFNDYAHVVSQEAALRFNEQLAQFERETSNQLVVVVFRKMESDSDIADYTRRVAQSWGIGQADKRNGAALFVFVDDHKMYIQVGYGLEGAIPDVTAFDITERHIKPRFRANDYEGGLATGIELMMKAARGEYTGTGRTVAESGATASAGLPIGVFVFVFILFLVMMVRGSRRNRRRGWGYSGGGGPFIGGWGGGGGGWGGGGSSGGGFSGFGGGGGSFGGGGGGSSW
ncbi:MAG: TPM domain-containing protein [Verrucomicrobiota bacterium]|nr:TPM domain-containing protein [Verrucomicrobiota bacterium]